MKSLIVCLLMFTNVALAEDSRMEQLRQLFTKAPAVVPTPEELSGWWLGRCFEFMSPNRGEGSISVNGWYAQNPAEDGPLFQLPTRTFNIIPFTGISTPWSKAEVDAIEKRIRGPEFVHEGITSEVVGARSFDMVDQVVSYRRAGPYFVSVYISKSDSSLKEACYYWQKIHE